MVISIRTHIGCRNINGLARRARTQLLPIIRELEGFKSLKLVKVDEDTVAIIIVFQTRAQVEAANEEVQNIVRTKLAQYAPNPPEVMLGDILWETRW
jgi:hypothetical protein